MGVFLSFMYLYRATRKACSSALHSSPMDSFGFSSFELFLQLLWLFFGLVKADLDSPFTWKKIIITVYQAQPWKTCKAKSRWRFPHKTALSKNGPRQWTHSTHWGFVPWRLDGKDSSLARVLTWMSIKLYWQTGVQRATVVPVSFVSFTVQSCQTWKKKQTVLMSGKETALPLDTFYLPKGP